MVLREVFIEVGELLNLTYEKNSNGTYRVNMVIRQLVYPELYMENEFIYNEIGYYLKHTEVSFQDEPNIRNVFSEFMRPKEKSNRYPTTEFCKLIDIDKMYDYYQKLFLNACEQNMDNKKRISDFIQRILEQEMDLHAKLKLTCKNESQFLVWIIIFSMFNSTHSIKKLEKYLELETSSCSSFSMEDTGIRHKISDKLKKDKVILNLLTVVLIVLNLFQIFFVVLPLTFIDLKLRSMFTSTLTSIIFLIYSILLFALRFYHMARAKEYTNWLTYYEYYDSDDSISGILKKALDNKEKLILQPNKMEFSLHTNRENLKKKIYNICWILMLVSFIVSIILNSLPVFICGVFMVVSSTMLVDRRVSDQCWRCRYDKLTLKPGERPVAKRGMAKLYQQEYSITGLNFKNDYYNNPFKIHSATCFKYIFTSAYRRNIYMIVEGTLMLLFFNILILAIDILIYFFPSIIDYLRIPHVEYLNTFLAISVLVIGIYNILSLIETNAGFLNLAKLAYASCHAEKDVVFAEKTFLYFQSIGKIYDLDVGRGIFMNFLFHLEQGHSVEEIKPETDRILFFHRVYAYRPIIRMLVLFFFIMMFSIFIWHFKMLYLLIPIIVLSIFLYIFLSKVYLIGYRKNVVIHEIHKLRAEQDFENGLDII